MPSVSDGLPLFLLGAVLGSVVTLALTYPWLGRVLVRLVAVLALALGAFMLIWPAVSMIRKEPELRPFHIQSASISITTVSEAFGSAAFLFVFGGLALGFSFRGRKKPETCAAPSDDGP